MSRCVLKFTGRMDGERFVFVCENCGEEVRGKRQESPPKAKCGKPGEQKLRPLLSPPLPLFEIERRLSICKSGCEHWNEEKQGCKVCGTCGSGQAMLNGLLRDPGKRCPYPGGSKWGEPWKPIKVAFLSPSMNLGGAERWIISLCRNFDPFRMVAHYVLVKDSKYSSDLMKSWLPKHVRLLDADRLPEVMEQVDFLISWGCLDLPQRVKGFAARVIDVQHGTLGFSNQKEFAAAGVKSGAHLACVHETCLLNFEEKDRERVTVIQNGADEDRLIPNRPPTKDRPKTVLFIGRYDSVKNLDGLARAILYLPHDWHLVAAGPHYQMPKEFPALAAEGRLTMLEPQDNLGNLFQDADVFCAPSHHEANSLAVLEAFLFGIPVVTTSYPTALTMRDKFGTMQWLVPVNPKPQELAAKILEADAAGKGSEQVLYAQETARLEFTAKRMADRWTEFISGLQDRG